jgi:TetR/AcrR family transcriptional repressor of nem operon
MARPSKFDRDAAVQAVMQEIWRSGYEASSVKAIAEKLGITRSSYYNAFGTREDLFRAALAAYFAQSPDRVLHESIPDQSVRLLISDTFRKVCAARGCDPEGRGCLAINSLCELAGGPHAELGAMLVEAVLASAARFEMLLELAVARGELEANTDVHGKALALQSLLIGINTLSKAVRSEDELWLAARTSLEALGVYEEENA